MSACNRVFITGLGALTATGETADETWNALQQGQSGIAEIKQWDLSSWTHRLGGELKDFQPAKKLPDRKLLKVISRQDVLGINAAMQAVSHSQLPEYRDTLTNPASFNEETAVYVGSPGNKYLQQYDFLPLLAKVKGNMHAFATELFNEVHPMWLLRILPNNVLAYTGIQYGFKGPNHNITNHAVSGTQAIIEAYHAIRSGQAERAVVVAYDIIEPQSLFYYEKIGVLSARHLKPFDKDHDGTILAEGAAAFVLESEASCKARAATCYGEITGGMATTEAAGLFSIESEGESLAQLLANTLKVQGLHPKDIGLLVAHGNGSSKSDNSEAFAIHSVFAEYKVPVTAFKWSMGHTVCASGIIDAVLTTYALRNQCIPGIPPFTQPAPASAELNLSAANRPLEPGKSALIINRGFASMNACLVIKPCE
ncbi:MAG: beta-ketoacyl synthase N-terminal-like domain-containing protein [Tatlockia sp.]|jgi:3-oxoacyl-[acyl-carrier-protein] synthase-1